MNDPKVEKAIRTAIKQGDIETMMALIGCDRDRLQMMTVFGSWLDVAAAHGKLEIVKKLVAMGIDINARGGPANASALHSAASSGHLDVVKYLIEAGAELDTSEPERNPLFGAIHDGHTAVAKLLIDSGIDTTVKYTGERMKGMDALAFAREWGSTDIAKLLQAKESA